MMKLMERTLATVSTDGHLVLSTEIKAALSIPAEAHVEILVGARGIRLLIDPEETSLMTAANRFIAELQALTAEEPRLSKTPEDILREQEDIDAMAGSLAGGPDMVAELQQERRLDRW